MNGAIPVEALPKPKSGRDLLAAPPRAQLPGTNAAAVMLIILALAGAFFGFATLTQATMGVGLVCGACLVAILARIAQAGYHHGQLLHVLTRHDP